MKHSVLIVLLTIFTITGCKEQPYTLVDSYIFIQKEKRENQSWKVVWQDDFEGTELDTSKWTRIPPNKADWGKHMSSDDRCYALEDGKIHLKGIVNPDTIADPRPFLTGGIYTKGKFAFQYGKVEINAKLECAQGAWPAMWMLPEHGSWPKDGEIDIMEHLNFDDIIYQTTHSYYTVELGNKDNPPHGGTAKIDINAYNTFGLEWYPDKFVFSLNGVETFTYPKVEGVDASQWPFDQPFYILIDQQLGGSWVGRVHPENLPVSMIVDWVKVYQ